MPCAPALITLRNEFNVLNPHRDLASDGCCPSAAHTKQNPNSDHEPRLINGVKYCRAYDIDEDLFPGGGSRQMDKFIKKILSDKRTKYEIYEGVLEYPDGTKRKAKGHDKHMHVSIHDWAVTDTRPWNIREALQLVPVEEDDMKASLGRVTGTAEIFLVLPYYAGKYHIKSPDVLNGFYFINDGGFFGQKGILLESPDVKSYGKNFLDNIPTLGVL